MKNNEEQACMYYIHKFDGSTRYHLDVTFSYSRCFIVYLQYIVKVSIYFKR